MPVRARGKVFEYAASVDEGGRAAAEAGATLDLGEEWSPEHLMLFALLRCTLSSLRYHARRAGAEVTTSGKASGTVTKRESDGRYAFVDITVEIAARFDPPPEALPELLAQAERDCFVGASLIVSPAYTWVVGGNRIASSG